MSFKNISKNLGTCQIPGQGLEGGLGFAGGHGTSEAEGFRDDGVGDGIGMAGAACWRLPCQLAICTMS